jgi:hypothetical protein
MSLDQGHERRDLKPYHFAHTIRESLITIAEASLDQALDIKDPRSDRLAKTSSSVVVKSTTVKLVVLAPKREVCQNVLCGEETSQAIK